MTRMICQREASKHVRRSAQTENGTRKDVQVDAARQAMGADVCSPHAQSRGARLERVQVRASLWSRGAARVAKNNCSAYKC